jgi:hypothetical protein
LQRDVFIDRSGLDWIPAIVARGPHHQRSSRCRTIAGLFIWACEIVPPPVRSPVSPYRLTTKLPKQSFAVSGVKPPRVFELLQYKSRACEIMTAGRQFFDDRPLVRDVPIAHRNMPFGVSQVFLLTIGHDRTIAAAGTAKR